MSSSHDVPRATRLGTLGALVALSAAACEAVDHTMGAGRLNAAGGGDSADESDHAVVGSVNGVGGVSGVDVSVNTTSGGDVSDDVAIPDSCLLLSSFQDEAECALEMECDGALMSSRCFASEGFSQCDCSDVLPGIDFRAYGITLSDACSQTLEACLNWPEGASGLSCITVSEVVDGTNYCANDGQCELVIDGDSDFTATYEFQSDCIRDGVGWNCGCGSPSGSIFTLPPLAFSDPPCLDARGWCGGIGVEPSGNVTCTSTPLDVGAVACAANVGCQKEVTLSGQRGTMFESAQAGCNRSDNALYYDCYCSVGDWSTEVATNDLPVACDVAVSLCETEILIK